MSFSLSNTFLFIHNPRTAGVSIRCVLEPYIHCPPRLFRWLHETSKRFGLPAELLYLEINRNFPLRFQTFEYHVPARKYKNWIPDSLFDRMYKFSFVRNPWDREVSIYHYLLTHKRDILSDRIHKLGSFKSYLKWKCDNPNIHRIWSLQQSFFMTDDSGKILVDFIGRFESMESDLETIKQRLNIIGTVPHMNRTDHTTYRTYYDSESVDIVAAICRDDVENFGYQFED